MPKFCAKVLCESFVRKFCAKVLCESFVRKFCAKVLGESFFFGTIFCIWGWVLGRMEGLGWPGADVPALCFHSCKIVLAHGFAADCGGGGWGGAAAQYAVVHACLAPPLALTPSLFTVP